MVLTPNTAWNHVTEQLGMINFPLNYCITFYNNFLVLLCWTMFWFATFLWFCVEYFDILSGKTSSGHKQGRHYNHEYLRSVRKWINVFIYISPVTHNYYWQLFLPWYFKVATRDSHAPLKTNPHPSPTTVKVGLKYQWQINIQNLNKYLGKI